MVSGGRRLGQVEPRERAGAQTGRKYEYQYERTARAALDLLADTAKHVCVYCDWHDDYVVEVGDPPTRYVFHQVKGRKSSQGPWTFNEFFGVLMKKAKKPPKRPATAKLDAIARRMVLHHKNFNDNCAGVAFVTNAGLDPALSEFLGQYDARIYTDVKVKLSRALDRHVSHRPALERTPVQPSRQGADREISRSESVGQTMAVGRS